MLAGVLLATGATQSNAQNTVLNIIQDLNFKLTGYYQMSPTENSTTFFRHAGKVSITNKDIINLLEKQVNIIFSSDAKLLLISEITEAPVDPTPKVVVRDTYQGEKFDTDVTEYFSAQILTSIEDTKINKNPLKTNGSSYDVIAFEMQLTQVHFRILGFGKTQVKTGKYEGEPVAIVHTGTVDSSGSGDYQVNIIDGVVPVALTGTVKISDTQVKASAE
jgi:hypothetical protein